MLGKSCRARSPFVKVFRKAADKEPVQESKEITVKGGNKLDVTRDMTSDEILEAFALAIGQPSRTEVRVMKNDKVQHKKLLTYDRLEPETEYSVEVLAIASSAAQVSDHDTLKAAMEDVWSKTCPAWSGGCHCYPGRLKSLKGTFVYDVKNQMILEKYTQTVDSDDMVFVGRDAVVERVKELWDLRQSDSWNRDKTNAANALLAVTNSTGYGKSTLLVQAIQAVVEKSSDMTVAAPVTYNSGMGEALKSSMGFSPLGMRLFFGAIAAMRPRAQPSGCLFNQSDPWMRFCSELRKCTKRHFPSNAVSDYIWLLRDLYDAESVIVVIDELSKCEKSEVVQIYGKERDPGELVCTEIGKVIDSDPKTLVLVSSLSPTYARQLVTGSNRRIVVLILKALLESELDIVVTEALLPTLEEALKHIAQLEGKQVTDKSIEELRELALRCARLSGGHPRTLAVLIDELRKEEKLRATTEPVLRNDVNFAQALQLFLEMRAGTALRLTDEFMEEILSEEEVTGEKLVTLTRGSNISITVGDAIAQGAVHVVRDVAGSVAFLIDVHPFDIMQFIRNANVQGQTLELQAKDGLCRTRALCFLLKPPMQNSAQVTPAALQERIAVYLFASEMLRVQDSGGPIFPRVELNHSNKWGMKPTDSLVIHDYSSQKSTEFYAKIEEERANSSPQTFHLMLAPDAERAIDAVAIGPSFLLGLQVKGGGVLMDTAKASEHWEGKPQKTGKKKKGTRDKLQNSRDTAMSGRDGGLPACDDFLAICFFDPPSQPLNGTITMRSIRAGLPQSVLSLALASAVAAEEA